MEKQNYSASIARQLQIVFAISILILIVSSTASFLSNNKLIETSRLVNHTNEVIRTAEHLISTVKDAETGQRGYIITNDNSFLEPYNGAYQKSLSDFKHLKELTRDNVFQQDNLDKIKVILDQRFTQMQATLQIAKNKSVADRSDLFLASEDEMSKGKKIMDDLRAMIQTVKNEENRLLKIRADEQETYIRYTPILVVFAALISILISVFSYLRIKADLDERVKKQKEDEDKYLETSLRIAEMEQVTRKIAEGDYAARSLDKKKDDLGRVADALNTMVSSLERSFTELENKNWLQSGTVKISNAVRDERFVKTLSGKIIETVAEYVHAQVGTLYIADANLNLQLSGGYAVTGAPGGIAAGQGLMGQAITDNKIIISDQLPGDYIRINSSIGNTLPVYAVIVPLQYAGRVMGALELGMLRKPTGLEISFLENNAESLSIALNAAINYERIQSLLEETQSQAEELQSQHNELENTNAELEAQSEKLQASDEELRTQQEELQTAYKDLEERSGLLEEKNQLITEKNLEVQRKADELAQTTKYKSEFLANMSHELRTPLNSILLLSRLLSENGEANLNKDQVEYAKVIQSSGNGLLALIDEILDLSKIEAGKMSIEYEDVSVKEIGEDMRVLFEAVAHDKKLALEIVVAPDVPNQVETDKMRLEQVLKNLISNALKFTTEGSVVLDVQLCKKQEGYLNFAVIDTGIGIPEDKQKLIFEAFQQADGSTRRKFGGTGLGLSISKELARLLGGNIFVESKVGIGSTFTMSIPLVQQGNTSNTLPDQLFDLPSGATGERDKPLAEKYISTDIPESIPDDRADIKEGDKTILIVEDDINFARSLIDFTRKKGYKAIATVRGDEGVELARKFKPSGILLDVELPVKNGLQVMEEIKSDSATRHIPIHIISSHPVKNESLMKGAIDFTDKPFAAGNMGEIFKKIEHVINRTSQKVLIVEDNSKHAKALAYFLETANINSEIKNTVEESIQALKQDTDCVILDMGIPGNNAYNTLEKIKKNPELASLPIIVFTGKSLSMTEEMRIKQYADSIVVKTANSFQRMLDEVSLFLHLVEKGKDKPRDSYKKLGMLNDVLKDKKVLIVDDDVRNIFSLSKALEKMNMKVITAIDGQKAIEKLYEELNVDIVLLDMMMPQMDGYETATAIRKNKDWKDLPVIAVTAKAMTGDREKCIQAGASDYITKPVDIDQLQSLLRVWLYERT